MSLAARARAHHIRECAPWLEACLAASTQTREVLVPVEPDFPEWKLRQALIACDKYPEEYDGRFVGLRQKVEIGFRVQEGQLYIRVQSKILDALHQAITAARAGTPEAPDSADADLLRSLVEQIQTATQPERRSPFDLLRNSDHDTQL